MSVRVENNVLKIPIEISLEDQTRWRELYQQAQEMKDVANKIESSTIEEPGKVIAEGNLQTYKDDPFFKSAQERGPDYLRLAAKGASGPSGPLALAESGLMEIIPYLGEAMIATGVAKTMFEWYFSPGAPGDIRFKRDIPHEREEFLSREEQMARVIGLNQVIITSNNGFSNLNGARVLNTLDEIRKISSGQPGMGGMMGRARNIGLDDKSFGWVP